jgi:hypothetical protein
MAVRLARTNEVQWVRLQSIEFRLMNLGRGIEAS